MVLAQLAVLFLMLAVPTLLTAYLVLAARSKRHADAPHWPGYGRKPGKCNLSLVAVIGSGGHTKEMVSLIKDLEPDHFPRRTYIVAETDAMGAEKVNTLEAEWAPNAYNNKVSVVRIPRSREVGQSYASSVWTTLVAFGAACHAVFVAKPDVVLCNGPGTCLPVCIAAFLMDLTVHDCRIVFVESVCRVTSLSLTGKLLYHLRLADVFFVQWPDLRAAYRRTTYQGILT